MPDPDESLYVHPNSRDVPGFNGARVHSEALLVDRRGSLWVGTRNDGLYRISGGVADHYGVSDGLSGNSVGSLFEDREGNIWVLTDGGLDMFRDTALISYTTRQGISDRGFHSVMALRNGAVWISTDEALNILRKQDGKTVIFDRKLSGQGVGPMLEDHSDVVWLGGGFGPHAVSEMDVFEKSVGSVSRGSAGCQVLPKTRAERFGFLLVAGTSYSALLGTKLKSKPRRITTNGGACSLHPDIA